MITNNPSWSLGSGLAVQTLTPKTNFDLTQIRLPTQPRRSPLSSDLSGEVASSRPHPGCTHISFCFAFRPCQNQTFCDATCYVVNDYSIFHSPFSKSNKLQTSVIRPLSSPVLLLPYSATSSNPEAYIFFIRPNFYRINRSLLSAIRLDPLLGSGHPISAGSPAPFAPSSLPTLLDFPTSIAPKPWIFFIRRIFSSTPENRSVQHASRCYNFTFAR